jgi:homoserine kinase
VSWPAEPVTVLSPASSANLGPGFDSLGLALGLHDRLQARIRPGDTSIDIHGTWPGKELADDGPFEDNLIFRAMAAGFAAFGDGAQPPGLVLQCVSAIPQGFGLGSSAAAIVAGLLAARELAARRGALVAPDAEVLQLATELEGHPDNVAACLYGGLTIAWGTGRHARAARLDPLPQVAPVVCVPTEPLATQAARMVLPAQVPHADAAANSARAALLIAALTRDTDLLLAGTQDFLHQPYRAEAMPDAAYLIARLREAGIAAVVSGAGPSVLALTVAEDEPEAAATESQVVESIANGTGAHWRVMPLPVDAAGARVLAE